MEGREPVIAGVVQVGQAPGFGISPKFASRLLPDGWVGLNISGCRYHFRTFQLELDILGTQNFGIGSVVTKLQPLEVGRILEILIGSDTFQSGFGRITVHLDFRVGFGKISGNIENSECLIICAQFFDHTDCPAVHSI